MFTRRNALSLLAGAGLVPLLRPGLARAQSLETEGPLGDVWLGNEDAPVTVIEYASLTCSFCARYHQQTFPHVKENYIEPGRIRYTMREFPLDPLATAGFMLARCEEDRYYAIAELLFETQRQWAFADRPLDALQNLMRQAGFSQEKFESCLRDQSLFDAVQDVRDRGAALGVNSTPTFFFNGEMRSGALTTDEFDAIVQPLLPS